MALQKLVSTIPNTGVRCTEIGRAKKPKRDQGRLILPVSCGRSGSRGDRAVATRVLISRALTHQIPCSSKNAPCSDKKIPCSPA
jgi:hypothetical protein